MKISITKNELKALAHKAALHLEACMREEGTLPPNEAVLSRLAIRIDTCPMAWDFEVTE